jgi:hypothetical protein
MSQVRLVLNGLMVISMLVGPYDFHEQVPPSPLKFVVETYADQRVI